MNDVKLPEYPSFYEVSGDINDINTLLVNKNALLAIHEQGRLAGLESAAQACLDQATSVSMHVSSDYALIDHNAISRCVSAIRALAASDGGK